MDYWGAVDIIGTHNIKSAIMDNNLIGIIGAGRSGVASCKLALKFGYKVILSDISKDKRIDVDKNSNLFIERGEHSDKLLKCDMLIISPGIPLEVNIIQRAIKNDIPIIGEIEFASWFVKSDILAITGSNGKSTTCMMLHNILLEAGIKSFLGGNIGVAFSENLLEEFNLNISNSVHVLELSSFQIETLDKFQSKVACILNISEDHLDRYKNMDSYINAKLRIADFSDKIVYDFNDPILKDRLREIPNAEKINHKDSKYKIVGESIYCNNAPLISLSETSFIGHHNLLNVLSAATIANLYGIDDKYIINSIKKIKPLPHRLEFVESIGLVKCYNDSKSTNIESTIKALESFDKNVILILGGLSKGNDFTELVSSLKSVSRVYCYGKSGKQILDQLKNDIDVKYFKKFSDCINQSIEEASENENILLSPACASFDQFSNFEERGNAFKEIISRYLDV